MTKVAITPNASGTGTFTIAAPNSNTNRTLTLPDVTTTLVGTDATQTLTNKSIAATQLTGDVAAARITNALNATGSAPIYACRAWVNFDGSCTVAIRASGNVSSITDNGVGDYTVNFTTAMSDANYSVAGVIQGATSGGPSYTFTLATISTPLTTSSARVRAVLAATGAAVDGPIVCTSIFR